MIPRPPRSTRTDTLFPYTPLFRSENATAIGPSPLRLVQAQRDIDDPAACPAEAAPKAVPTGLGGQFRQVQTGFPIGLLQRQRRRPKRQPDARRGRAAAKADSHSLRIDRERRVAEPPAKRQPGLHPPRQPSTGIGGKTRLAMLCAEAQTLLPQQHACKLQPVEPGRCARSEEHTSELQSLMRISYAVFCLKKKNN